MKPSILGKTIVRVTDKFPACGRFTSVSIIALILSGAIVQAAEQEYQIKSQRLEDALMQFAEQADVQLLLAPNLAVNVQSKALSGNFAPDEALSILLKDTDLSYSFRTRIC